MKTIVRSVMALLLVFALVLSLSGCCLVAPRLAQKEESKGNAAGSVVSRVYGLRDTATLDGLSFTASDVEYSDVGCDGGPDAAEGYMFVAVEFTVENVSNEKKRISTSDFGAYADGVACERTAAVVANYGTGLHGTLDPGKKMVGRFAVEAPEDFGKFEIVIQGESGTDHTATFAFYLS